MSTEETWLRDDGMTMEEIAAELGISTRRVQQIETNALRKLLRRPGLLFEFVCGSFEPVRQPRAKEGADR